MNSALLFGIGAFVSVSLAAAQNPTPLAQLLTEAEQNNPDILAAEHAWRSSTHVRAQQTALPDPQFTLQEFSVGSPRPFAGFHTSDFAYLGIGASQELPYPGKRRLRGDAADRAADVQQKQIEVRKSEILRQVKTAYLRLGSLQQTLGFMESSRDTLAQMIETALSRYSTGHGNQSDVLKAQLQRTRMLREITMHHQEVSQVQSELKQLLHREQDSPDVTVENLSETRFSATPAQLLDMVRGRNPEVQVQASMIVKEDAGLKAAQHEGKPDFSIGYMFQRTGSDFPAYYMLTFGMTLPRRQRVNAQVEQEAELLKSARYQLDSQLQEELAKAEKGYAAVMASDETLSQYREGLLPQAEADFQATLVQYQSGKEDFVSVLSALNDVLQLKQEYQQTLFEHEDAIVQLKA